MLNNELEFILKAVDKGERTKTFEQEWDKIRFYQIITLVIPGG